jgi:GDP-L-fucose synthase
MSKKINIFVAGHKGMVGSSLVKFLKKSKKNNLILVDRRKLDLTNQKAVENFFQKQKIDQVYLVAAKVGGIMANKNFPAKFIYENLMIECNVINSSFINGVKKIIFFGSSCIYPRDLFKPIKEKKLLSGYLESTNEPYAIAKIAGIKICESYNRQYGQKYKIDYRCIMPTNVYGPGDNYDPELSHVIPGMIYRIHLAKVEKKNNVKIWGTGKPKREFIYVDDLARAAIKIMNLNKKKYNKYTDSMCGHINVGSGYDVTIKKLAYLIKKIVNFKGRIVFDKTMPDGVKRKLLDNSVAKKLGITNFTELEKGLIKTYENFLYERN